MADTIWIALDGGQGFVDLNGRRVWVDVDEHDVPLPEDGYRLTLDDHVEIVVDRDADGLPRVVGRALQLLRGERG